MISIGSFTRRLTGAVLGLVLLLGAVTLLAGCRKHRSFRIGRRSDYVARRSQDDCDRDVVVVREAPRRRSVAVVNRGYNIRWGNYSPRVVRRRGHDCGDDCDDHKIGRRRGSTKYKNRRR